MNFERIVVIRNPVSTHAERGEKYIADLRRMFPNIQVVVLKTVRGGLETNEARLRERKALFGPRTLLGVIAGDGTFNMIATILMRVGDEAVRTVLVPLWGGNANDLAHILSGRAPRSLKRTFANARQISVRALECSFALPDGSTQTHFAICYASFGASAAAARRLGEVIRSDDPAHAIPGVRFVREAGSIRLALKRAQPFAVRTDDGTTAAFEWTFLNGSRMAKIGGLLPRLNDGYMHSVMVSHKGTPLVTMALHAIRLKRRSNGSKFRSTYESFVVEEDIAGQFDGETVAVAAGTKVTVTLARTPLKLLAARQEFQASAGR